VSDIVAALADLRRANPSRTMIHHPASGRVITADGLWQSQLAYTERLRAEGLGPQQVLVVAANNRPSFVALTVACRALKLVMVPVDHGTTTSETVELADRLNAAALIFSVDGDAAPAMPARPIGDGLVLAARTPSAAPASTDAAVMKLTSGSTGAPRATMTTEAQLIADARHIMAGMQIGPDDTQLAAIPLSHSYGMSVILLPLLLQGTPVLLRESFVPELLPEDARACGARMFPGVPFMFQHFVEHPPAGGWPPGLNKLISAGARLPAGTVRDFAAAFGVKIHTFYGTSESGGIAYDDSDDSEVGDAVGPLLPGVTVTFVADEGTPEGAGRIFVRSDAVSNGYAGERHDDFHEGGFLTGDFGAIDARGRLTLMGRVSSFVNVAGKKVDPHEVERVLRLMPGVRDVGVTAAPDPRRGQHVVACLVVSEPITAFSVREYCSTRLAPHKIPRTIVFVDGIPRTLRGKVDRRALDRLIASGTEPHG